MMEEFDKKWKEKIEAMNQEEPSESSVSKMMSRLDKELPIQENAKKGKTRYMGMPLRIAASLSLIVLFGYLVYQVNQVEVNVGKRAQMEITLPDGSNVMVNAESRLAYNKLMWYFERKVELDGEAFFEVEKGEKFSVHSTLGITEVLGTSFNVRARPKHLRVKCHTGKVRVTKANTSVVLNPGEGVAIRENDNARFTFDLKSQLDWRSGEFYFDATPFSEAIEEIERQFAVEITYPNDLAEEVYTGYFNNRNFDQAMRFVCEPFDLEYQANGNKIILASNEN